MTDIQNSLIITVIAGNIGSLQIMDKHQVGKMIHFHRKQSGLTQAKLAKLAGLGKTVIFDIEKGKLSIQFDTLLKVMHVLNIKIEFIGPLMDRFQEELNEKS